jgi:hypothetical protein
MQSSALAEINYPATLPFFTVHITIIVIGIILPYYGSKPIIILVICKKIHVFPSIIKM